MKRSIFLVFCIGLSMSVGAQTLHKCPASTPGAPPVFQQMPCAAGGEQIKVAPPAPSSNDAAEATARMKAYSDSLKAERQEKASSPPAGPSLGQAMDAIHREERAKECYQLKKRIRYIQDLEKEGVHLKQNSMANDDSQEAIAQYERDCRD